MNAETIDLSAFPDGATLFVSFDTKDRVAPFFVMVYEAETDKQLYKRQVNRNKVEINLPVTAPKILLLWNAPFATKSVTVSKLKKRKIPYKFQADIVQKRSYPITAIQKKLVPVITEIVPGVGEIPTKQPGRFETKHGIMELNASVLKDLPVFVRQFVQAHEEGHYYYGRPVPPPDMLNLMDKADQQKYKDQLTEDEKAADRYALYKLLNDGWNCSGMLYSLTEHLNKNYMSAERMKAMAEEINMLHAKKLI